MGGGRGWDGVGHLLTFSCFRMGGYSRLGPYLKWALIQGWALIRINTVLEFVSDIVDSSRAKQTDISRLEFSKAFDKVPDNRLLYKLENYGIRSDTLKWLKAFLENRQQSIVVDGERYDFVAVLSGALQRLHHMSSALSGIH